MRVRTASLAIVFLTLVFTHTAFATPPTLYSQPANESPVRADPDDLLLLPGYGFSPSDRVVYSLLGDTTVALSHPAIGSVPAAPTATLGFADVVSAADIPYSLTARLPAIARQGSSYALWVVNAAGEWSNGVKINDARPLWVTPDFAYASASLANLPRALKVVGRNLQPTPSGTTQVRLVGPTTYTLTADNTDSSLSRYSARVSLPNVMSPGTYSVQVSRDGISWIGQQSFTVKADPVTLPSVFVHDFACDSNDDTTCIVSAINSAAAAHPDGATVVFDARTYQLSDPGTWPPSSNASTKKVDFEGIWVPRNINLRGAGKGLTIINRGTGWITPRFASPTPTVPVHSLFNLQGNNTVQGFTFSDANVYTPSSNATSAALQLGIDSNYAKNIAANPNLSNIIITQNEFKTPFVAIENGGLPLDHLFITSNIFGAYQNALYINRQGNVWAEHSFQITDSVVAYNTFYPGSYDDPVARQGTIASQMGGGTRLDFSNNVADGTGTNYLYNSTDRKGFRAAFFWNLGSNNEMKLISENTVECSSDKSGDGEGIVFDGADERSYGGFLQAAPVAAASSSGGTSSVTVNILPAPSTFGFIGQWLQIVQGPGVGQLRKITGYSATSSSATFVVSPAFDVLPQASSTVVTGLQNWQAYIVHNSVDQSSPLCVNLAKSPVSGGHIAFYAQTADSAIEGNSQYSTTGIQLSHQYILDAVNPVGLMLQSSNEVRNNIVNGAVTFAGTPGRSGIWTSYVATPSSGPTPPPPVLDFGVSIGGNQVIQADDVGGSLEFLDGGQVGFQNANNGCSATWQLGETPLVFHNNLNDHLGIGIDSVLYPRCGASFPDSIVWHTVAYGNSCHGNRIVDNGVGTVAACSAATANGCECPTGALSYWKFDEGSGTTVGDSGSANNGTLFNSPVWTTGKTGSALNFSRPSSYVAVNAGGNLDNLYTTGMTLTAWINPAAGSGRIVDKDNNNSGWFFGMASNTAVKFVVDQFGDATSGMAASLTSSDSIAPIALNKWQHVAVTWNSTNPGSDIHQAANIHIYINGVKADGVAVNGVGAVSGDAGTPFTIGNRTVDLARNFNGSIDGVRIYHRVLSQQEIQSLVNGGS